MLRRNFLKKLGLGALVASIPSTVHAAETSTNSDKEEKKTYKFDDLFYRPYGGNGDLIYVRNESALARMLYETKGGIDEKYESDFNSGFYFPVSQIFVPVKEKYTESDFDSVMAYLRNKYEFYHFIPFASTRIGKSPMRFIANNNGYMKPEFWCQNNS